MLNREGKGGLSQTEKNKTLLPLPSAQCAGHCSLIQKVGRKQQDSFGLGFRQALPKHKPIVFTLRLSKNEMPVEPKNWLEVF